MAGSEKKEDRTTRALILIFLILSAGIIFAGYLNYTNYAMRYRSEVERQLSVIGDLKIAGLVQWRKERLGDAQVFYRNDVFSRLVRRCLETPEDPEANRGLRSWLSNYQAYHQYDRILLLDTRYAKRLVVPDKPERTNSFVSPSSSKILKSGRIAFEDFYWNEHDQRIYLKMLVPIFEGNGSSRMIAVLAFRIDPNTYLYPYINSWPTASETAETLLVRRDGNGVVFLNELRFQKNTALKLRFPLERLELPVVKAVLGRKGIVEGRDYRDKPVIAVVRAVPDSPWYLSARMDISEMNAPLRERLTLLISLVAALLVGAGASVGLVWRQQRLRYYHEREEAAEALQVSEEIYRRLVETAKEAIYVAQDGMLKFVNRMTVEITGYSEQELTSTPFSKIIHPDDRDTAVGRHLRRIKGEAVPDRNQCRIIARDGSIKWADISGVLIEWEGKPATLNVLTDITERKQAEEALRQSEENFRRSLDESPLGVRIVTLDGETLYANRALLDIYGYDSIEELRNTPVKKRYTPESYLEFQTRREQRRNGFEDPSEYAISIIRKDGSVRHLQVYRKEILWDNKGQYQVLYLDITYRELADERLRESEERYRTLIETTRDLIYTADRKGSITYMNQALEKILGYTPHELNGKSFAEILAPDFVDKARDIFRRAMKGELIPVYEAEMIRKDGGRISLEFNAETLYDERGKPVGRFGIGRDITERKQAEEALKRSEEKYRDIFETILEGIYRSTPEGRFVIINPAFAAICGYASPEEMMEKVTDIPNQLYANPEDRLRFQKRIAAEGKVQGFEIQFKHPTRGLIWVSIRSKAMRDEQGNIRYYDGTIEDITDRKRAEGALRDAFMKMKELEFIIDHSPAVIWLWKAEEGWPVEYVSSNVSLFGYAPDDFVSGRIAYASIVHPDDLSRIAAEVEWYTQEGRTEFSQEYRILTKSGGVRWIDDRTWVRRAANGTVTHYQGIVVDITDRKRAEDELRQSYQQLRALAERLQQIREESQITIAREIHDELGGGLTGLKMDLSLLSQKIEDEKEGKDHDFLMKRIHSANKLIDGLIQNVRHIGTKLRPSVLDDLGLIAALEWESEEFTNRTGTQCELVSVSEYITLKETTATAVFRIFQEALTNVARHSGADKVTVLFREEEGYLYLEVMDNGRGITEGEMLGMKSLGILGMRERALVFGGELSISGEPGIGTTVILKIPGGRKKSR